MEREEVQLYLFIVTVVPFIKMNPEELYYDTECTEQLKNENKRDR